MILTNITDPQVTENFHVEKDKMRCPCCGLIVIDMIFLRKMQIIRDFINRPMTLDPNGGAFSRCEKYNNTLQNSVKDSQHLYGRAMDVQTSNWDGITKWKAQYKAMQLDLSIGKFKTYIHFDGRLTDSVSFP